MRSTPFSSNTSRIDSSLSISHSARPACVRERECKREKENDCVCVCVCVQACVLACVPDGRQCCCDAGRARASVARAECFWQSDFSVVFLPRSDTWPTPRNSEPAHTYKDEEREGGIRNSCFVHNGIEVPALHLNPETPNPTTQLTNADATRNKGHTPTQSPTFNIKSRPHQVTPTQSPTLMFTDSARWLSARNTPPSTRRSRNPRLSK